MATLITMPKLSYQMDQGTIVRWLKSEGDRVEKGEALLELETDKAVIEVPSSVSGAITEIFIQQGDTVAVGQAILKVDGGDQDAPVAAEPAARGQAAAPQAAGVFGRGEGRR